MKYLLDTNIVIFVLKDPQRELASVLGHEGGMTRLEEPKSRSRQFYHFFCTAIIVMSSL